MEGIFTIPKIAGGNRISVFNYKRGPCVADLENKKKSNQYRGRTTAVVVDTIMIDGPVYYLIRINRVPGFIPSAKMIGNKLLSIRFYVVWML